MPQCLFLFLILKHICQFAAKSTYLFISHGNDWPSSRHLTVDIKSHSNWGMNSLYENVWNNIMLQDMSRVKWCRGPEAIPLAGDWGAAGHIHLDQWQSSIRLDQSEAKDEQRSRTSIFFIQKKKPTWRQNMYNIQHNNMQRRGCNYLMTRTSFMWMTLFGRYISNEVTSLIGVIAPQGKLCASSSHPKKSHKTWFDKCICLRACDHIWV